jgi:hypothetical protein
VWKYVGGMDDKAPAHKSDIDKLYLRMSDVLRAARTDELI